MDNLTSLITELKGGLAEPPFTFDDRVLAALAKRPSIQWCAENAATLTPDLKRALASIYRQAEYRGGKGAAEKTRAAFARLLPDDEKLYNEAKPIDFWVEDLTARGLPANLGDESPYFAAVRSAVAVVPRRLPPFPRDGRQPAAGRPGPPRRRPAPE